VAGLSAISGRRFLVANLVGRMPMVFLFTLVGANGFAITPALLIGLTLFGALLVVAWFYFIVRDQQETQGSGRGPFSYPWFHSHRQATGKCPK